MPEVVHIAEDPPVPDPPVPDTPVSDPHRPHAVITVGLGARTSAPSISLVNPRSSFTATVSIKIF